jgi:hypothetical protein
MERGMTALRKLHRPFVLACSLLSFSMVYCQSTLPQPLEAKPSIWRPKTPHKPRLSVRNFLLPEPISVDEGYSPLPTAPTPSGIRPRA